MTNSLQNALLPSKTVNDNASNLTTTMDSHTQTVTLNTSLQDGCLTLELSEMEYIPWDNPDNIISAEGGEITRRVMDFVLIFLFLIGGPGNVINMVVFYKQSLKDRVNLCLFALALADEIYLLAAMLFFAEHVYLQFTTKEVYGPMMTFLTNSYLSGLAGFFYVSFALTAIIASERCYCVLRPLKYQTLMYAKTMAIIIIGVYVIILGLYYIVSLRFRIGCVKDSVTGVAVKAVIMGEFYTANKDFIDGLHSFLFGAGLPGVVMIVVITATMITIVKLRQIATWRAGTSSVISPREVALTKMLASSSILFIICVFPVAVTWVSLLFLPEVNGGRRNHNLFVTFLWINNMLTYINSSHNIIVYYIMGSRYRETFWQLFSKKTVSEKRHKNDLSLK